MFPINSKFKLDHSIIHQYKEIWVSFMRHSMKFAFGSFMHQGEVQHKYEKAPYLMYSINNLGL